jgi:hypothetical protein
MNKQHHPDDLEANRQPDVPPQKPAKVSPRPPLQLPFENAALRRFSDQPVRPRARDSAEEANENPTTEKQACFPPGALSLGHTLDELEEQLSRRLYGVQKRLVAVEKKIEFQQKVLIVLTLIWAGLAYFDWTARSRLSPRLVPTPTEQQFAPPLERSIPVQQGNSGLHTHVKITSTL